MIKRKKSLFFELTIFMNNSKNTKKINHQKIRNSFSYFPYLAVTLQYLLQKMKNFLLIVLLWKVSLAAQEYIVNGDFELFVYPFQYWCFSENCPLANWTGSTYNLQKMADTYGQYVDLQRGWGNDQNGYISQAMDIMNSKSCNLTFYQRAYGTNYASYVMEIYWNGFLITTHRGYNTSWQLQLIQGLIPINGTNSLTFAQIGVANDSSAGTWIDNVSLLCEPLSSLPNPPDLVPVLPSQESALFTFMDSHITKGFFKGAFSSVSTQLSVIKFFYLLIDDLWLYSYTNLRQTNAVQNILRTAVEIEKGKMNITESLFQWAKLTDRSSFGTYKRYVPSKFLEVEGTSTVLLDSSYEFFVYFAPMNSVTLILIFLSWRLLKNTRVGAYLEKYAHLKNLIVKVLLVDNLSYFVYICFSQLRSCFAFSFASRMYHVLALIMLYTLLIMSFIFFWANVRYSRHFGKFFFEGIKSTKSGTMYLTLNGIFLKLLRGIAVCFLYNFIEVQIIILITLKVVYLFFLSYYEAKFHVFKISLAFAAQFIYTFQLILFDFSIYAAQIEEIIADFSSDIESFQELLVYLLGVTILLKIVSDFLPEAEDFRIKKKKKKLILNKENFVQQKILTINKKKKARFFGLHKSELTNLAFDEKEKEPKPLVRQIRQDQMLKLFDLMLASEQVAKPQDVDEFSIKLQQHKQKKKKAIQKARQKLMAINETKNQD